MKVEIKEETKLEDLKQKLINHLAENVGRLELYDSEIELLEIILDYEKK